MVHMGSMQHFQMSHVGVRFCSVVEDMLVTQVIGLSKMYRVLKISGLLHRGASFPSCQLTFPSPQPGWNRSSHPPQQKGAHLTGAAPDFKALDVQGSPATALLYSTAYTQCHAVRCSPPPPQGCAWWRAAPSVVLGNFRLFLFRHKIRAIWLEQPLSSNASQWRAEKQNRTVMKVLWSPYSLRVPPSPIDN